MNPAFFEHEILTTAGRRIGAPTIDDDFYLECFDERFGNGFAEEGEGYRPSVWEQSH